jgi:hypothetical protein
MADFAKIKDEVVVEEAGDEAWAKQ